MPNEPLSPLNPVQPSDFMKNDIPAETDDLELGRRNPDDVENMDAEREREDKRGNTPQAGRH